MSVTIIGDRKTGKTSMVRALAEHGKYVKVANGQNLVLDLYDPDSKLIAGTDEMQERSLVVDVDMPATGERRIKVSWIDTPGEFWSNPQQRKDFAGAWQALETKVSSSQALILLLPPHQGLVQQVLVNNAPSHLQPTTRLPTTEQWVNRLAWWLEFLERKCRGVKHVLIGIHKADLFCDVLVESNNWRYRPDRGGASPWYEYQDYVLDIYFTVASKEIRKYKSTEIGSRTRFFITTTENQDLLELPWLYLAPYIAYY
ncbi:MAG: hypothetical protein F6K47_41210 [Symploca sp. SIO2E6]|nr:hypothetical protein [Symploca sp. SIO2E6]